MAAFDLEELKGKMIKDWYETGDDEISIDLEGGFTLVIKSHAEYGYDSCIEMDIVSKGDK